MVSKRIEPVIDEFRSYLFEAAQLHGTVEFMVSPPMYRKSPTWYREGLPEILTRFSSDLIREKPANVHLLPSFPTPDFEADGLHLTAYSGLEFVLHLFDCSVEILDSINTDCATLAPRASEATRLLEDRMVALEQDHRRLNQVI